MWIRERRALSWGGFWCKYYSTVRYTTFFYFYFITNQESERVTCENRCTCVHVWVRRGVTGTMCPQKRLHLWWERVRIVRKRSHEKLHTEIQMSVPPHYQQVCNTLWTSTKIDRTTLIQPPSNRGKERQKHYVLLQLETVTKEVILWPSTRRSSSDLRTENALDSAARRPRRCSMVRHPNTGQNLLMTGVDLSDDMVAVQ